MKIIISPAKKMKTDRDSIPWNAFPVFLGKTEELLAELKKMPFKDLRALWKCNDSIAEMNMERLQNMDLRACLTPAILAYEGIQYRYMAPGVFSDREYDYIQNHLRILSGFYGILKPFDGVTPYRLEMQAKLRIGDQKDLYAYWAGSIAEELLTDTDCVINLASKEYSVCISRYLRQDLRFITCIFGEKKDSKILEKGTLCKMARGEMVRYMAEHQISDPEQIKSFDRLNYKFSPEHSDEKNYVFLLQEGGEIE